MSFKITIEVADTKLAATLRLLTGYKVMVENISEPVTSPAVKKKMNGGRRPQRGDFRLTMTGKQPMSSSKLAVGLQIFEKFEKKQGIGSVTVKAFREELVRNGEKPLLQQRMITERCLNYLE